MGTGKNARFGILFMFVLFLSSCINSVRTEDLYGRWNYIKVDNLNPADSLTIVEIRNQSPVIIFSKNKNLVIEWDGKQLSHGTFRLEGKMIRYTEFLEGNRKREFPFLIKKITDTELIFETMEQNFTRVTARKAD